MNLHPKTTRYAGLACAAVATIAATTAYAGPAQASAVSQHPIAGIAYRTLTIVGTSYDDHIDVVDAPDGRSVRVSLEDGRPSLTFARSDFSQIVVFLRGGDDDFHVHAAEALVTTTAPVDAPVVAFGEDGDDVIAGGTGSDRLFGGYGDDDLTGGAGTDLLSGDQGNDVVDGGAGLDREFLGDGADVAVWFPGEASDAVHGGRGYDSLDFRGSGAGEVFAVSPYGDHAVLTRDLGAVRMDTDEVEAFDVAALGGADKVTVNNLDGTSLRAVNLDLSASENLASAAGDGDTDTVVVNGTSRPDHVDVRAAQGAVAVDGLPARTTITGSETSDQLRIYTLGGRDSVVRHRGVADLITTSVNLGAGQ